MSDSDIPFESTILWANCANQEMKPLKSVHLHNLIGGETLECPDDSCTCVQLLLNMQHKSAAMSHHGFASRVFSSLSNSRCQVFKANKDTSQTAEELRMQCLSHWLTVLLLHSTLLLQSSRQRGHVHCIHLAKAPSSATRLQWLVAIAKSIGS